jgi:hypothetical protein
VNSQREGHADFCAPIEPAVISCYEFFGIYLCEKTFEQTLDPMTAVMNAIQLELLDEMQQFPVNVKHPHKQSRRAGAKALKSHVPSIRQNSVTPIDGYNPIDSRKTDGHSPDVHLQCPLAPLLTYFQDLSCFLLLAFEHRSPWQTFC